MGARVRFLDEVGGGVVLREGGPGKVWVRTDDGFELELSFKAIVPVLKGSTQALHAVSDHQLGMVAANDQLEEKRQRVLRGKPGTRPVARAAERPDDGVMEVDLHLHEVVDDERGLTPGEELRVQLAYFERMLAVAIRERKQRMIVIHGVGEGVLREEVRRILEDHSGLRFNDADPRRYGQGATEVEFLHYRGR